MATVASPHAALAALGGINVSALILAPHTVTVGAILARAAEK
jgi:hypothetical protein